MKGQLGTIKLTSADIYRGDRPALRNVSFDLPAGSLTAVIGPNGAGKSSLFGALSGRLAASAGEIDINGSVAEVLQSTAIDEDMPLNVEDVIRMGRYANRGLFGRFNAHDKQLVSDAIATMDLQGLRKRPIQELSGGQKQRVLVAQGLVQESQILLLDEPTTGLDIPSQAVITSAMRSAAENGQTVLFSTHNLEEARDADYLIVLASECICCAPPVDAFADPTVTALFSRPAQDLRSHPTPSEFAVQAGSAEKIKN